MTTDIDENVRSRIRVDAAQVKRETANALSVLNAQVAHMVWMAPWLVDQANDPLSNLVSPEYLSLITTEYQTQLNYLRTEILPKMEAIEKLGSADPLIVAEGRAVLDVLNASTNDIYTTRYNVV